MDPSATTAAIAVRRRLLAHVGSLRAALALMGLLALVALLRPDAPSLAVVFAALGANLLAALVVHPLLRRRLPLLVFHVALLALVQVSRLAARAFRSAAPAFRLAARASQLLGLMFSLQQSFQSARQLVQSLR